MIVAGFELTRMTLVSLLLQRLDRLRARIIELAGLTDNDRSSANDEDLGDVCAFGHYSLSVFELVSSDWSVSVGSSGSRA